MPVAATWGRVAVFDAIRASNADVDTTDDERAAVRRQAAAQGSRSRSWSPSRLYEEEQELKRFGLVFGGDIPYSG